MFVVNTNIQIVTCSIRITDNILSGHKRNVFTMTDSNAILSSWNYIMTIKEAFLIVTNKFYLCHKLKV